jgi:hypothetical protein
MAQNRATDGRFTPGTSGNPNGRPPSHHVHALEARHRNGTLDEPTQAYIHGIAVEMAADGGGWEHATRRERVLMDGTAFIYFVIEQIMADVAQNGVMLKNGRVRPVVARELLGFTNTLRCNLVALGLRPERADRAGTVCQRCHTVVTGDLAAYLDHQRVCAASVPARSDNPITVGTPHVDDPPGAADAANHAPAAPAAHNPPAALAEPREPTP